MTTSPDTDLLNLSPDAMRERLAASPEAAAGLLRAGAEAGLPEAQALYGQILLDGRGVAADPVAALGWFRKAAGAGYMMAINMVGRCLEKGWGTRADPALATQWFKVAAEGGLDWGMYNYGSALGLGSGIVRNEQAALDWFRKAAALGHAKSINFVGAFHEEGRLVPRDRDEAARCYRIAAERGDFRGQFNHARMLAEDGRIEEAADWFGDGSGDRDAGIRRDDSRPSALLAARGPARARDADRLSARDARCHPS